MIIRQSIKVSVLTDTGLHHSKSMMLSASMSAEDYVQEFMEEKKLGGLDSAKALRRWTIEVEYHEDYSDEHE